MFKPKCSSNDHFGFFILRFLYEFSHEMIQIYDKNSYTRTKIDETGEDIDGSVSSICWKMEKTNWGRSELI
ncbi:hypothetical protein OKN5_07890 [Bacillus altitudinis]